jgi:hypothetical protein
MFGLFWKTIYFIFPCINKDKSLECILDDEYIFEDEEHDFDISKLKIVIPK